MVFPSDSTGSAGSLFINSAMRNRQEMDMKKFQFAIALLAAMLTTGCVTVAQQQGDPDVYSRNQAMAPGIVCEAIVLQVREVKISASEKYSAYGSIAGGLAGYALTKGNSKAAAALGVLAGALAGGFAGKFAGESLGEEIVVRLSNGEARVIVQERGTSAIMAGNRILVLVNGPEARIVRAQ